jgi:hypothetical protein
MDDLIKRLRSNDRDMMCRACRPAADALGITPARLSAMENGRADPAILEDLT